jgi:predicted lipid-binding transport protein (Tim44 family)
MKKKTTQHKRWIFLAVWVVVCFFGVFVSLLEARVGGGHGYSGGGGSGGGGGGGGGGEGWFYLIYLLIRYPKVGIPVLAFVVVYVIVSKKRNPEPKTTVSSLRAVVRPVPLDSAARDRSVSQLQQEDPNFSLPLFMDFVQLLYTHIIQFAGRQELHKMSVYLNDSLLQPLAGHWPGVAGKSVRDVIIGNCSIVGVNLSDPEENIIMLLYESNYTIETPENPQSSGPQTYYEVSRWILARKKGVISKGPGEMNRIGCPNCGGSLDDSPEGKCSFCGHEFEKGAATWYVRWIGVLEKTLKSPEISGGYALERGTQLPTRFQPDLARGLAEFKTRNPDFNEADFYEKAGAIFKTLQEAWSSRRWELARPFETDSLFQTHLYWITLYKKERMRNVLQDIRITKIEPVKIQGDAYFDALTVRIHCSMIDYTRTDSGRLTGGDPKHPRPFTEYWTFIRRAGLKKKDKDHDKEKRIDQCPNCGSELKIGMVGKCEHCGSKITSGEFSWVLSLIEQDESYTG